MQNDKGSRKRRSEAGGQTSASALGFEATLWATADKLRGNLDEAEYKHVVLGLHESRTLAALRDALLPKLLSGELRIPAASELVEAHA